MHANLMRSLAGRIALPCLPPPAPRFCATDQAWSGQHLAVTGLAHHEQGVPCQDAAFASPAGRPLVLVADGAGSAAASERGGEAVVAGTARLLDTLERQVAALLDGDNVDVDELARLPLLVVKHAMGLVEDRARQLRRDPRDVRCTLLMILGGQQRGLWLKVGDGALVVERQRYEPAFLKRGVQPVLETLGSAGKGEFANQTTFIGRGLAPDDVQHGVLDVDGLSGLAAMSDGAAERLVSHDGSRVGARLATWLDALRAGRLKRRELASAFYSEIFTKGASGDDCSLALSAAGFKSP